LEVQGVPGDREVMGDGEAGREGELEGVLDAEAPWGSELEGVLEEETPRGREVGVPVEVPEAEPLVDKEADALTVVDAVLMAELDSVALWEGEPLPPGSVDVMDFVARAVRLVKALPVVVALPPMLSENTEQPLQGHQLG
jgi:hypothetical protein